MYPTLLKLGPITINSYGLMMALGFLLALYLILRDARAAGLDAAVISDLAFWTLLVGLIGARIAHIFLYPSFYSWSDPIGWIAIWKGGLVFQGGPPPAILFCYWVLRKKKQDPWKVADVTFPYLALAHAIGRIGCFLKGCCYGANTSVPWGVRFPRVPWNVGVDPTDSPAYLDQLSTGQVKLSDHWSLPVHPTQLYESLALVVICLILLTLRRRWRPFDGFTMPVYFVLYGIWRFFNEFYRGDHNPTHFSSLSDQQLLSLVFAAFGIGVFFVMKRFLRPRGKVKRT